MFKVNNKDTRTTPDGGVVLVYLLLIFEQISHHALVFSFVNFEHVKTGWPKDMVGFLNEIILWATLVINLKSDYHLPKIVLFYLL